MSTDLPALVPGYKYELSNHQGFLRDMLQLKDGLKSGKTKDLGDVHLKRSGEGPPTPIPIRP
jgi:hypothetical protein